MTALSSGQVNPPVPPIFPGTFSTKDLAPEDQFDAWRTLLSDIIELQRTPEASQGFAAEFSSWTFGDIIMSRAVYSGAPPRRWKHRPRSFLDHWCVVLAHSQAPGRDEPVVAPTLMAGDALSFRSLALPFEGGASDSEVLTLFLPRDLCRDEAGDFERAHDLDIRPELGSVLAGFMDHLARQLPHISADHGEGLAVATRALVSACIAPRTDRAEAAQMPLSSLLIDRARLVIRQNMASPEFGPEALARLMAMSRSKLYRLFEHNGGVAHFINRERLREAHRQLAGLRSAMYIHLIGSEVGFPDHSTFSRAFRREFGYSPSEVRERGLALPPEPQGQPAPLAVRLYGDTANAVHEEGYPSLNPLAL